MEEFDIAIIGGGMVGASLALALAAAERRIVLIEGVSPDSRTHHSFDERTTALGNASRRILQALEVWDSVADQCGVIRAIHVSDAGQLAFARLDAREQGIEAFGYVVPNRALGAALWEKIRRIPAISVRVPATVANLSTTADGVTLTLAGGVALAREVLVAGRALTTIAKLRSASQAEEAR